MRQWGGFWLIFCFFSQKNNIFFTHHKSYLRRAIFHTTCNISNHRNIPSYGEYFLPLIFANCHHIGDNVELSKGFRLLILLLLLHHCHVAFASGLFFFFFLIHVEPFRAHPESYFASMHVSYFNDSFLLLSLKMI